jgi:phage-related protein
MTSPGAKSRIRWEGSSNQEIRGWPEDVRQNIGAELQRLEDREKPLDSRSMGSSLPGVSELRDEDGSFWYRLLYWPRSGWIYVLHCFKKKTNQTSKADMELAKERMKRIRLRNDAPAQQEDQDA